MQPKDKGAAIPGRIFPSDGGVSTMSDKSLANMGGVFFLTVVVSTFGQEVPIYFQRDWDTHIYSINIDGTNRTVVAEGRWPVLSPDGGSLIIQDEGNNVSVISTTGGSPVSLGKDGGYFTWSPDGQQIMFQRYGNLHIVAKDGSAERLLVPGGSRSYWSPNDLSMVYFNQGEGLGPGDLFRINIITNESRLVRAFTSMAYLQYPVSPDGRRLFVLDCGGACIKILDLTSGELVPIGSSEGESRVWDPAWSPDGSRIVFSIDQGKGGLHLADADGQTAVELVPGSFEAAPQGAVWSADGKTIAFHLANIPGEHRSQLYLINVDGSGLRKLTEGSRPMWALKPSGSHGGNSSVQGSSWGVLKHSWRRWVGQ